MAPLFITSWFFSFLLICCLGGAQLAHGVQLQNNTSSSSADAKLYIVYMSRRAADEGADQLAENHTANMHFHLLKGILGSAGKARSSLIYSYTHAISGFAAVLSPDHVKALAAVQGVVRVVPSEAIVQPVTTNSWNFLELSEQDSVSIASRNSTIIGVIDSGVNPELLSFRDDRLGPVPERWKGACDGGLGFPSSSCNRKLIGVRYYVDGWRQTHGRDPEEGISAFDRVIAHGTHVASTAGGDVVRVQMELASGDVRGGNPLARIAVYKIFWDGTGGTAVDLLKALDDAIADGVDIINLSVGYSVLHSYDTDPIAIASFSAMRKNILTVHGAGNDGPEYSSITATVPWTITVAATTTNRDILSPIQLLGLDGLRPGFSTNFLGDMPLSWYGLVSGESARQPFASIDDASRCRPNSLDAARVAGKIVYCKALNNTTATAQKIAYLRSIGVAGVIIEDDTRLSTPSASPGNYPLSVVSSSVGSEISQYIRSYGTWAMARILRSRACFNWRDAPTVAGFSSRGPNNVTHNMLKPDIAAPGVSILAGDGRQSAPYSFMSGTSMAAPHVSGVASLMRAYHGFDAPWSPAALKSALMTTASVWNNLGQYIRIDAGTREANPFDYGYGRMQPLRAINQPGPGLIYDTDVNDYVRILCALGYDESIINNVFLDPSTDQPANCAGLRDPAIISQVNFPSIAIGQLRGSTFIIRTLTNVATSPATYAASIAAPPGVLVSVTPSLLQFSSATPKITYVLHLQPDPSSTLPATTPRIGFITWADAVGHRVQSPIVIHSVYSTTTSNDMEVM